MHAATPVLTPEQLTDGATLIELCTTIKRITNQTLQATHTLNAATTIHQDSSRLVSAQELNDQFHCLHSDFNLALHPHVATLVTLMRNALQRYITGDDLLAVHIERRICPQGDFAQWMAFSFNDGTNQLDVQIPLVRTQNRQQTTLLSIADSPAVIMHNMDHLEPTCSAMESLMPLFNAATLAHTQNRWTFVSMPSEADIAQATQVLQDSLPIFQAVQQHPITQKTGAYSRCR